MEKFILAIVPTNAEEALAHNHEDASMASATEVGNRSICADVVVFVSVFGHAVLSINEVSPQGIEP